MGAGNVTVLSVLLKTAHMSILHPLCDLQEFVAVGAYLLSMARIFMQTLNFAATLSCTARVMISIKSHLSQGQAFSVEVGVWLIFTDSKRNSFEPLATEVRLLDLSA